MYLLIRFYSGGPLRIKEIKDERMFIFKNLFGIETFTLGHDKNGVDEEHLESLRTIFDNNFGARGENGHYNSGFKWGYCRCPEILQIFDSIDEIHAANKNPDGMQIWYRDDTQRKHGYDAKDEPGVVAAVITPQMQGYERYRRDLRWWCLRNPQDEKNLSPTQYFLQLCDQLGWGMGYGKEAADGLGISVVSVSALKTGKSQPSKLMLRYMQLLVDTHSEREGRAQ